MSQHLIIGYGNTLRSDDGAGQYIAETVETWNLPEVQCYAVHQLTPELADAIAKTQTVIFVDVQPSENQTSCQLHSVTASSNPSALAHSTNPQALLYLTEKLYQKTPKAYWLLIPAMTFEFGETFSAVTQKGIEDALDQIKQLLDV